MDTMNRMRIVAAFVCVATLGACGDDASPLSQDAPAPGLVTLQLSTPNADDGALSVVLQGDGIEEPVAVNASHQLFTTDDPSSGEVRLALVGNGLSGGLVQFRVPDVTRLQSYTASLIQVADESSNLRSSLAGYRVGIVRSP